MKATGYLFQAALISFWWIGLVCSATFFQAFQFDGISETAFWAFFAPDVLLIAVLSLVRAYKRFDFLNYIILGAFSYATIYCCNASLLTQSGLLPTGMMLLGLAYNLFLCTNSFLFRASTSSHWQTNACKTLLQIFCVWSLALVVIPFVLMESFQLPLEPLSPFTQWTGIFAFGIFGLLGLISSYWIVYFGEGTPLPLDQTNKLVIAGPYRYVRNPMALAGIGQGVAVGIYFGALPILIYSLTGAIIWHFVVRPIEEQDLADRFGEPYLQYQKNVRCWLPSLRHQQG